MLSFKFCIVFSIDKSDATLDFPSLYEILRGKTYQIPCIGYIGFDLKSKYTTSSIESD